MSDVPPESGAEGAAAAPEAWGAGAPDAALDEATPAPVRRARARLALVALAAGLWLLPWSGREAGPLRAGAPAVLALVESWGLAATALLASTRRGLLLGEAATSAATAGFVTVLVATGHPWLPGPEHRGTWVPIFGPLALLAILDLSTRARRIPGTAVAVVRGASALVAAAALAVALQPLPAVAALLLAAGPVLLGRARSARGARRAIEALAALVAVALLVAPEVQGLLAPPPETGEVATAWVFLWRLAGVALVLLGVRGVVAPEGPGGAASPSR